ncbi:MAG: DUF3307 domain-containing protein [bacterium]
MPDVLFFLLFGHFLGDYALQSDYMAQNKGQSIAVLSFHVLVYTVTLAALWWIGESLNRGGDFFRLTTLAVLAGLYLAHWLQDYLKSRHFNHSKQSYYIDQAVHVGVLFLIRVFF